MTRLSHFLLSTIVLTILIFSSTKLDAQTGIQDTTINLQITSVTSTTVDLAWNTPPNAVNCTLTYRTVFDTVTHSVPLFALGNIQIPRQNPRGLWEVFIIEFARSAGAPVWDDGFNDAIGDLVLIEDDIFIKDIVDECNILGSEKNFLFRMKDSGGNVIKDSSFFATRAFTCTTTQTVLIDQNRTSEVFPNIDYYELYTSSSEEEEDSDIVYNLHYIEKSDQVPVVEYEHIEFQDGTSPRLANAKPVSRIHFSFFFNPSSKLFLIKPDQNLEGIHQLEIRDMTGRIVHNRTVDWSQHPEGIGIPAAAWRDGIYTVHIDLGRHQRQVIKLLKH